MKSLERRRFLQGGIRTAGTIAIAAPLSGCATLAELLRGVVKAPEVQLRDVQLLGATLDTLHTRFDVEIANPNPIGFRLDGLAYALAIDGDKLARGAVERPIALTAQGRSRMSFPLSFPLARTAETLLRVLDRKEVPYALDSRFRFRWAQGEIAVPVHFAGELPVPAIPKIAVRDFSISALGLDGLRARVIASVTNPNSFSIPIDRLRFHARLNGNTVLQNELFRAVELAPQKSRDLPLDLRVGLAELGLTAASLARRPRLDWELSGDVQAGLFAMPLRLQGQVRAP